MFPSVPYDGLLNFVALAFESTWEGKEYIYIRLTKVRRWIFQNQPNIYCSFLSSLAFLPTSNSFRVVQFSISQLFAMKPSTVSRGFLTLTALSMSQIVWASPVGSSHDHSWIIFLPTADDDWLISFPDWEPRHPKRRTKRGLFWPSLAIWASRAA